MFEEEKDNHQSNEIEDAPAQRRERGPKKLRETKKETKKLEPEKVYFLVTAPNSHEEVAKADLAAAGARVVSDSNLKLYEATLMEPKISF